MKKDSNLPLVLIILDGWGVAPEAPGNAIRLAKTPNIDKYIKTYPATTLLASGEAVGLAAGEVGNSEVGHLNMGLGRVSQSDLLRINNSIADKSFFSNQAFLEAFSYAKKKKSKLHIICMLSDGGIHSHEEHLYAFLELVKNKKIEQVYIHAILDGWDSRNTDGLKFIKKLIDKIKDLKSGVSLATISGRFYAMDRTNNWHRTELAFKAMTMGEAEKYADPIKAIEDSYKNNVYDDKFKPVIITKRKNFKGLIEDNDSVVFLNFRTDRARQLTKAFCLSDFQKFPRADNYNNLFFVTMTNYDAALPVNAIAYPKINYNNSLPQLLSNNNLRQLYITETEKYAQLTYFFHGSSQVPFANEVWQIVPSLAVDSYVHKPGMMAKKVTSQVLNHIIENSFDFIVINYPNTDIVAHTGDLKATIKACQIIDKLLGKIVPVVLSKDGMVIITADHGNAEELQDIQTGEVKPSHTNNPVPLIMIANKWEGKNIGLAGNLDSDLSLTKPQGKLADIAPTILKILNIEKPEEMTGESLI